MMMKFIRLLTRHGIRATLSVLIVLILFANTIGLLNFDFISRLENFTYDMRLTLTMPNTIDDRVVIVDIDEKSLQEDGRWPWSRNKLAVLMDKLFDDYKIKVIGFDVVFAEKDESSGLKNLEDIQKKYLGGDANFAAKLDQIRTELDYDQTFANSLKGRNVVMGYYFRYDQQGVNSGVLPQPTFKAEDMQGIDVYATPVSGYGANLEILQKAAISGGHFNPDPDQDGITRKIAALQNFEGNYYEALSIAVARIALGATKVKAGIVGEAEDHYAALEWLQLGDKVIPVDGNVASLVPYRGKGHSFPYVSASDVLRGKVAKEVLEDRIVLLGTTSPGLNDLRAAPIDSVYPGVEVHANMIAGILDGNVKEKPAYMLGAEAVWILLIGLLLATMLPVLNPLWGTMLTLGTLMVTMLINLSLWQFSNLVMPVASTLLLIGGIYMLNMSYGFFVESRSKKQLAGLFGQYIPPELVDEMVEQDAESFTLEGESREMTILFSDVRGFTTISEGLDPKQLSQLMNEFLTPMTHVIHHGRGTIDKYMGDAIMAFWGAPLADPNHARHAIDASIGMLASLQDLNVKFKERGWPELKIGVGLNTGVMTVGNMGSEFRTAYTVMGDAVNLGSRLESLTKKYGVYLIVSEFTKEKVPEYIYRELDIVRVKGKDKPVAIFEPVCLADQADKDTLDELAVFQEALKLFRKQDWDMAEIQFVNLRDKYPGRYLYEMYLERIAHYRNEPPGKDWDGVYTHEEK